ncbi:MAG: hypothetical protein RLO81_03640 [Fulvivirga sp.]|uniref:hypothetical protein n=1 Tax=Fulvivirga sp. TaxID=1931237 RepID=UPI0032ED2B52
MVIQNVFSNVELNKLLNYSEVGYLKEIIHELSLLPTFDEFLWYIYFKRTSESDIHLPSKFVNKNTILFIVGDESDYIPLNYLMMVRATFKTYLAKEDYEKQLFYLPVGPNPNIAEYKVCPIDGRKWNVFFSGNLHKGRKKLYQYFTGAYLIPFSILHRLRFLFGSNFSNKFKPSYIMFTNSFQSGLSFDDYSKYLYDSKIVLCPPGNPGTETMRHFEALRAGCVVISEELPRIKFFENSPIIIVQNWKSLNEIVMNIASDSGRLKERMRMTLQWWENYGAAPAVAKSIMQKITK